MSTAERSVSRIRLTSRRRGGASRGSLNGGIGFLAALSGFAVLYVALALVHPLPNIYPDENLYSSLATSLAHGRGLTWRGDPVNRHEFLVSDPRLHVTFYNELHSARDPHAGRLVAVSDHPRVRAIVITPCERPHPIFADGNGTPWPAGKPIPCDDSLDLRTWSDESGRIEIRFRGAPVQQHSATINLQQHPIPPKRETIVSVHVPAGAFHRAVVLDWAERSPSVPQLLDVVLIQHGQRTSLL